MADEQINEDVEVEEMAPKKAAVPWIPLILVLLFIPIITLVLVEFVVIPKLRNALQDSPSTAVQEASSPQAGEKDVGDSDGGKDSPVPRAQGTTVVYEDIISNVAGTMGTRFLKVSFQIVGDDPQLASIARMRDAQVRDSIITTLSSRTIQEIEVVGGRNTLRVALIGSINEALGVNLVDELYFLDFIIQ